LAYTSPSGTEASLSCSSVRSGSYAAAKLLLAYGAKVDAKNEPGNTALMEATLRGDEKMVAILLQAGASNNRFI
jgi:ankyrin repeat protein